MSMNPSYAAETESDKSPITKEAAVVPADRDNVKIEESMTTPAINKKAAKKRGSNDPGRKNSGT